MVGEGPNLLWRPLTTLTFALDHALHGLEPFGYHLVNVVLHAAVTVLVLSVLAAVPVALRTAVAAALLFAVHPIHTEAVASVVGRAELLAAAGFFLAWRFWLAGDAAAGSRREWAWTVAAAVAYFLAMCGKENAVALPAVLVFADLLRRQESSMVGVRTARASPCRPGCGDRRIRRSPEHRHRTSDADGRSPRQSARARCRSCRDCSRRSK